MKDLFALLLLLPFALAAQPTAPTSKVLNIFTFGDGNGTFPSSEVAELGYLQA